MKRDLYVVKRPIYDETRNICVEQSPTLKIYYEADVMVRCCVKHSDEKSPIYDEKRPICDEKRPICDETRNICDENRPTSKTYYEADFMMTCYVEHTDEKRPFCNEKRPFWNEKRPIISQHGMRQKTSCYVV